VLHTVANLTLEILAERQQKMIFVQRMEEILGRSRDTDAAR